VERKWGSLWIPEVNKVRRRRELTEELAKMKISMENDRIMERRRIGSFFNGPQLLQLEKFA